MDLIAATADVLGTVPDAWGWLTTAERTRGEALRRQQDRDDFVAAHVLVRQAVGRLADVVPCGVLIAQTCEECGGPHGRPRVPELPGVHVSFAHSSGWVGAMASDRECGVDVENVTALRRIGVVRSALTPRDAAWVAAATDPVRAFARLWVRKEALLKAGAVDHAGLRDVELTGDNELLPSWSGFDLVELPAPGEVVGAVAKRQSV